MSALPVLNVGFRGESNVSSGSKFAGYRWSRVRRAKARLGPIEVL
jgi:hypothetical protein